MMWHQAAGRFGVPGSARARLALESPAIRGRVHGVVMRLNAAYEAALIARYFSE